MENNNTIGKDFTLLELIKFVTPAVLSKLVLSLLSTIDDSLFISRYCGKNALAAFSIALPWFMLIDAISMVVCSVSAKCSVLMGEKKNEEAKRSFTSVVIVSYILGLFLTIILSIFKDSILDFLGATEQLKPIISSYMNISRIYIPLIIVSNIFARFYIIAGKPRVAVASSFVQIFCNLFFDWLLIAKLNWGIIGAAYGNLAGFMCVNIIGIIFFGNDEREICFGKPLKNPWPLLKEVIKLGRAPGLTSLAVSVNSFIVNQVLLSNGGEFLVAGYTVVNNVQFMFMNAFFGFLGSISPIVSYAFGEKNSEKLSKRVKQAVLLIEGLSLVVSLLIVFGKNMILNLYFAADSEQSLKDLASYGFNVVPFVYPIFSFNILVQEFLVAVTNHRASTFLSVLENVICSNLCIIVLPMIFGVNAIWFSFLTAECITLFVTCYVVYINRDVYGYGKNKIATFINN